MRRRVKEDLTDTQGIHLTIKGDGRNDQLRLRQDGNFDGVARRRVFSTDGSIQAIDMAYEESEPVFRGRIIKDAGVINPTLIR